MYHVMLGHGRMRPSPLLAHSSEISSPILSGFPLGTDNQWTSGKIELTTGDTRSMMSIGQPLWDEIKILGYVS